MTMSRKVRLLFLAAGLVACCCGQERLDPLTSTTVNSDAKGIQFYGVSLFAGFSSLANPASAQGPYSYFVPGNVQSDWNYGAQWSLGWHHLHAGTAVSLRYTGMYSGQTRYSNLNAFGHALTFGVNRTFHTKWSFSLSATGDYRTLVQYIFAPSALSTASQTPATFDNLAAASGIGNFSDPQAASALSGAPQLPALVTSLLGDRILTYAAQASVSYAATSRLSFDFASFGAGGETKVDNAPAYVLPRSMGASAGVGLNYALSPRTTFGVQAQENRVSNHFQTSYGTTASASLGRKMTEHWFLSGRAGMSYTSFGKQVFSTAGSRQVLAGGSLGYRAFAHTIMASYSRSSMDAYGMAVGLNESTALAWSWRRPGSSWIFTSSIARHTIHQTGFLAFSGWSTNAGVTRMVTSRMVMSADYAFLNSTGDYLGNTINRTVHSLRLTLGWHPAWILP
jgi:hypothetical protein